MSFHPKVSIVIPVYNGSNYLKEAIDSALNQTYKNIEIIVMNDGSNDEGETDAIAKSYGNRIRYYYKENGGVATALNIAISKAEGEYISWLSHDDILYPEKTEKQINYLEYRKDSCCILFSDYNVYEVEKNKLYTERIKAKFDSTFFDNIKYLFNSQIHGCTLLIPIKSFKEVGNFNESLRSTQDYELWFKMIKNNYKFQHIPYILIKTRRHQEMGTRSMGNIIQEEKENLFIWANKYFSDVFDSFTYFQLFKIHRILINANLVKVSHYMFKARGNNKYRKMQFFHKILSLSVSVYRCFISLYRFVRYGSI